MTKHIVTLEIELPDGYNDDPIEHWMWDSLINPDDPDVPNTPVRVVSTLQAVPLAAPLPYAHLNVGQLRALLANLPDHLPLGVVWHPSFDPDDPDPSVCVNDFSVAHFTNGAMDSLNLRVSLIPLNG